MIGLEDIQSAAKRISPFIIKTPLERSQTLSEILGANAFLKMELFQKTGSFKPRGAFNQVLQLDGKAKGKGVVAVISFKPEVRIWGVETEGAQTMGKALEAGKVVHITPNSLAKTLSAPYVAEDALRIAQQHLAGYIVVSDQEAVEDQQFLLERAKVLTELAASCTLSAARKIRQQVQKDDTVVLLLCGGNESLANMIGYANLTRT